jgi:hypothetical protein
MNTTYFMVLCSLRVSSAFHLLFDVLYFLCHSSLTVQFFINRILVSIYILLHNIPCKFTILPSPLSWCASSCPILDISPSAKMQKLLYLITDEWNISQRLRPVYTSLVPTIVGDNPWKASGDSREFDIITSLCANGPKAPLKLVRAMFDTKFFPEVNQLRARGFKN